jgi:hypothetical protein
MSEDVVLDLLGADVLTLADGRVRWSVGVVPDVK